MKPYDERSWEVKELKLLIDNDADLYRQRYEPMVENQKKKLGKQVYNPKLSEKMWKYLADAGNKKYAKDYGPSGGWTPNDRREVAEMLRDDFEDRMKNEGFMRKDGKPTQKAIQHAMTKAQKKKFLSQRKNKLTQRNLDRNK